MRPGKATGRSSPPAFAERASFHTRVINVGLYGDACGAPTGDLQTMGLYSHLDAELYRGWRLVWVGPGEGPGSGLAAAGKYATAHVFWRGG